MPETSRKTAEKEIPRTTVDKAIRRGRQKVQEARMLRESQEAARTAQQRTVPATGMEQGGMLDPFNVTTVLRMMDGRGEKDKKDPHEMAEAKEPAKNREKPGDRDRHTGERAKKTEDGPSKEKETDSHGVKEVRTDEQGAVVEEKEAADPGRKAAGREASAKRVVRTIIGNIPVQGAVLAQENEKDPNYRSDPAETGARVFANMRMTDMTPEELRLNARPHTDPGKAAVRTAKGGEDERSGDRTEGLLRKEASRSAMKAALDTAYKPQENRAAEENSRPGREKEADRRAETQPARETIREETVTAPAESISRAVTEGPARREEPAKTPLAEDRGKVAEVPLKEPVSGKDAMNSIITSARENAEAGNLVMQAAAITHATGRELQFEKGADLMQIRKEGKETFAYINGEKADIGKARDFMKDLRRELGPELSAQMKDMVKTLSQNTTLSMQQAVGAGKQSAFQPQARGTGAVTRD